jgi:hypothetical protein
VLASAGAECCNWMAVWGWRSSWIPCQELDSTSSF